MQATVDLAIRLARDLIAIPSESSDPVASDRADPEAEVASYLLRVCREYRLEAEAQPAVGQRHNVVVRLPRPGAPAIVIAGHMDTVSGRGMADPFAAEIRDDRLWGRGACDDKGPLAVALASLIHAGKAGCRYDLTLVATVDEECSLGGAAAYAGGCAPFDLGIALEPTMLHIVHAHKGVMRLVIETKGVSVHSSTPERGRNAISAMLSVLADLEALFASMTEEGRATLAITTIHGGSSENIVPDRCTATLDIRLAPGRQPDAVRQRIHACIGARAGVNDLFTAPGIDTSCCLPLVAELQTVIASEAGPLSPTIASFATDCSALAGKGPCIVWGPGDISHAHTANEHIEVSQIEAGCRILCRFLAGGER